MVENNYYIYALESFLELVKFSQFIKLNYTGNDYLTKRWIKMFFRDQIFYYFTDTIKEVNACFNIGQYDCKMNFFLLY